MQYDNLPKVLRENGTFCLWRFEERQGQEKPAKFRIKLMGEKHSQTMKRPSQIMPLRLRS